MIKTRYFEFDEVFFHPECDNKGLTSECEIIVVAKAKFKIEGNRLVNPSIQEINQKIIQNSRIIMQCDCCGLEEDITDIINIKQEGYGNYIEFKTPV